jgi:hypothetical protein
MENEAEHGLVEDPEPGIWEEDAEREEHKLDMSQGDDSQSDDSHGDSEVRDV